MVRILFFSFIISTLFLLNGCDSSEQERSSSGASNDNQQTMKDKESEPPKTGLNFKMIKKAVQDYFSSKSNKSNNSKSEKNSSNTFGELGSDSKNNQGKGSSLNRNNSNTTDEKNFSENSNEDSENTSLSDLQAPPEFPSQSSDSPSDESDQEERKPKNRHKPNSTAESLFRQGEAIQKNGKCKQAIESFEKSIEKDPEFVEPLEGLFKCNLELKKFEQAKIYGEMADLLLSIHLAESARDLKPPLFLKEWRKRSNYEKLNKTDKMKFDKLYTLMSDQPIHMDLSILTGWSSFAKENGSRFSETQKQYFKKHEKYFYEKAATIARKSFIDLSKKISSENPDFIYYQTIFLLWEIKNLYWGEKYSKVKDLCESYQNKFPERYSEEEIDYWYYQPSLAKLGKK